MARQKPTEEQTAAYRRSEEIIQAAMRRAGRGWDMHTTEIQHAIVVARIAGEAVSSERYATGDEQTARAKAFRQMQMMMDYAYMRIVEKMEA